MSEIRPEDFPVLLISFFGLDFGAVSLGAYLEERGYRPHTVEFNHLKIPLEYMNNDYFSAPVIQHDPFPERDLELLLELVDRVGPRLVGLSVSSVSFQTAKWVTRRLREQCDAPIIWGGVHAIIAPDECIQEADMVCAGEGEEALLELCEAVRRGQAPADIPNLWFQRDTGVDRNPLRPLIAHLDSLPWPRRTDGDRRLFIDEGRVVRGPIINAGYMTNAYPVMTSRGCMFACSFCCNAVIGRRYRGIGRYLRRRSVDHVLAELRHAVRHSAISSVRFWDDVFTYDEEWIEEFCRRYPREVGRSFICYAHPRRTSQRVLELLSGAGLTMVYVGIQSGSADTNADHFNRRQTNEEIRSFARRARALGITPNYDVIVDNAFEGDADDHATSELLLSLQRPYKVLLFSLCFFPCTPLTEQAVSRGIIQEQQTEQHTAKALNNFFLVLDRSPGPRHLFWSCIKAMAANPDFPPAMVRAARQSEQFRRRPDLLLGLARAWARLRKVKGKQRQRGWLLPAVTEGSHLDDYIIWTGNQRLYSKGELRRTLHPDGVSSSGATRVLLRLGAEQEVRADGLQVEAVRFNERDLQRRSVWRSPRPVRMRGPTELLFELDYPHLKLQDGDGQRLLEEVHLAHCPDPEADPRLFVLWLKVLHRGTVLTFRWHPRPLAQSLCLVAAR